jgi:hypothetical protein
MGPEFRHKDPRRGWSFLKNGIFRRLFFRRLQATPLPTDNNKI